MESKPSIGQQLLDAELRPIMMALEAEKITPAMLARKLRSELNAKKTNIEKLRGVPNEITTKSGKKKPGVRLVTTSGTIEKKTTQDGIEKNYSDGDSLLAVDMIDWGTRQKARIDAHKLRGDYPAEKHEVVGQISHDHSIDPMGIKALEDAINSASSTE